MEVRAGIVTVGREILTGRVLNRNAQKVARYLLCHGIPVDREIVVSDDLEEIAGAIRSLTLRNGKTLIITTGGLGPTADDLTLEAIALACDCLLERNELALSYVITAYQREGLDPALEPEATKKMAYLPVSSIPIANDRGIAPAVVLVESFRTTIALPGLFRELEGFLDSGVLIPYLQPFRRFELYREERFLLKERDERRLRSLVRQLVKAHRRGVYFKTNPRTFSEPVELVVELWGREEEVKKTLEEVEKSLAPYLAEHPVGRQV
jgi:molybdopterin-biosynthesis enzyme MoeA-like protein